MSSFAFGIKNRIPPKNQNVRAFGVNQVLFMTIRQPLEGENKQMDVLSFKKLSAFVRRRTLIG